MSYRLRFYASFETTCFMCSTVIPGGAWHECSDEVVPVVPVGRVTSAKVTLKDGRKGRGASLDAAIADAQTKKPRGKA